MQFNQTANQVIQFINQTQHSVFLTGNAGTGKTTLVNYIVKNTFKKHVVVAPTGIAALNAKGVTIHSMFQLPFACFIPDKAHQFNLNTSVKIEDRNTLGRHFRMNAVKKTVIEEMELLVIDEVSMLRPDVLDAIDFKLQKVRRNYLPFGGVQVLFVGDLMQLPPVIGQDEWQILKTYYAGKFFFHAKVFEKQKPIYIELDKIYRQQDSTFIDILNQLRKNHLDEKYKHILNQKVQRNFDVFHQPGYIALTTHNRKADQINQQAIQNIDAKSYTFKAEIIDDFPEHIYPVDAHLILKEGAQVMFVKNDPNPEKQFFNGKMGVIKTLSANEVYVYFQDENKTIEVEKYEWENIKFKLNEDTKEIEEEKIGTFVQYPLKLAWAITVHKSQGLTFEKAVLDVNDVFVSGQMYVAFSRLTSLDGLVLTSPFEVQRFDSHEDVLDYAARKQDFEINEQVFQKEKVNFIRNFVKDAFDWKKNIAFWTSHIYTYQNETDQSFKNRSQGAITELYQSFIEQNKYAEKFISELKNIIDQQAIDFNKLHSRSQAALNYFLPSLRKIHLGLKVKIIDSQKQKRAKQFYKELLELDYHFLAVVLQLFRVVKFVECLKENQEINKDHLISPDFTEYHTKLKEEAISTHRERSALLVEDDYDDIVLEKKSKLKKEKEQKISTYQETLTLFRENLSATQIAETRKLTLGTIHGHFAKLISQDLLKLEEILSPERIARLKEVFEAYEKDTNLSTIKEQVGDEFTYGELKIGKISIG
jgi:hypothetical protein